MNRNTASLCLTYILHKHIARMIILLITCDRSESHSSEIDPMEIQASDYMRLTKFKTKYWRVWLRDTLEDSAAGRTNIKLFPDEDF